MASYPTVDYSSLSFPDSSGGSSGGDTGGDGTDNTLVGLGDVFSSLGVAAASIIPEVQGPQALAPGASYVLPGGKVVTTPTTSGLGSLTSPTFLIIIVIAVVAILAWSYHK
jgi:hypothetical protein